MSVDDARQPYLVRARVVKLTSDDHMLELTSDVNVGDVFIVDISTRCVAHLLNRKYAVVHDKEVVQCAETGGWLAVECIELFL